MLSRCCLMCRKLRRKLVTIREGLPRQSPTGLLLVGLLMCAELRLLPSLLLPRIGLCHAPPVAK